MGSARTGYPRRGPRPAGSDARGDILDAARTAFAEKGYVGASLRGIARGAGVDPALVHHYFDGKADLFVESVLAAPAAEAVHPERIVHAVIDGPPEGIGVRWVRAFLDIWDAPGGAERFRALVHGASGDDRILDLIRQFLGVEVFARIVAAAGSDRPLLRSQLAGSQIIGLGMARYVAALPGIADADADALAAVTGPAIQRYLVGDLPPDLLPEAAPEA